ncbi:protease PrsW [Actinomyces bowdenii]|uniref:Protease PrsW n=1 Tax=Actinomyces bowdenii TaxID=131109 RepID=A0A3P1V9A6_9ACTO|nr:protease PrsW [Actinomyces bowdenii]
MVWALYLVAIPLFLLALLVVPRLWVALVPGVVLMVNLGTMALLARTRTIAWRSMTVAYSVGVAWALLTAAATTVVAGLGGLSIEDDGAMVGLAAFVEEPAKLVPLAVVAVVAPGRMRRLAAVDWALLGFALGAGFTAAEDGVRRLQPPGLLESLLGESRFSYSLNPWGSGSYSMPLSDAVSVGHQVHTMIVAAGVGLAIALWRRRGGFRVAAVGLVALMLAWVIADHAGWNATVAWSSWTVEGVEGMPWWITLLWFLSLWGQTEALAAFILFVVCQLVDAHRRAWAGVYGWTLPGVPSFRYPRLERVPAWVRPVVVGAVAWAGYARSDLALVVSAYGDLRWGRVWAIIGGREMAEQVRGVRADAMAQAAVGGEPGARRRFALAAGLIGVGALLVCVLYGLWTAQAIGPSMSGEGDGLFFASLLDVLGQWWADMGPLAQILFTAWAVALLLAMGGSFAFALGAAGVLTWLLGHGRGLAAFLRDPRSAAENYFTTVTPGQFLWDIADFALTFVPGSALGLGTQRTARMAYEALATSRAARTPSHLDEMAELFAKHTDATTAWHADKARFTEITAQYGIEVKSFSGSNLQKTIEMLEAKGVDVNTLDELDELTISIRNGGNEMRQTAERVGERGGMHHLEAEGYYTPDAFHTPQGAKGPGPYHVDGFAMSRNGDELIIPEYKGGQSTYNPNKTYTLRQLDPSRSAPQGTPDYTMDRMLSDERVIQHLHDHPDLWQSIKEGRTSLRADVYQTPIHGETSLVHSESFSPSPDFIAKMEQKIAGFG